MQQEGPILPKNASALPYWSQQIFVYRSAQGWSQEKLAERIEADAKSVSRWENGVAFPKPFYREKLAEVFQTTQGELGFLQELLQRNYRTSDQQDVSSEERLDGLDFSDISPTRETIITETITISEEPLDSEATDATPDDADSERKHAWWDKPLLTICILLLIGAGAAGLLYLFALRH